MPSTTGGSSFSFPPTHSKIVDLDYAAADKTRPKMLLSSRDWETLATE